MNLPGKSKGGKGKKSTQTINTYQPNNTKQDYTVVIKIVAGVIGIGVAYGVYENYFKDSLQPQTAQFQIADPNSNPVAPSNPTAVTVPINVADNKPGVTEVPIALPNSNAGKISTDDKNTTDNIATLPSASVTVMPTINPELNKLAPTQIVPPNTNPMNVFDKVLPPSTTNKNNMVNTDSQTSSLAQSGILREEKLDQEKLKELIVPSLFSLQVKLEKSNRHATGFIVSANGYALCDFNSLRGALEAKAVFSDGKSVQISEFAVVDPARGLALLKLPRAESDFTPIPMLKFVPSNGENLFLASADTINSFNLHPSTLINERKPEDLRNILSISPPGRWLQTSLKTLAPNTGGAIIDAAGNLVGILGFHFTYGQQFSFILSSQDLREFVSQAESKPLYQLDHETHKKWEQDLTQYHSSIQSSLQRFQYHEYERRYAVDYTNSSFATSSMAEIDQLKLIQEDFGLFSSDGPLKGYINKTAEQGLKSADFIFNTTSPVEPQDPVIYQLIYSREGKKSDPNVKELRTQILVIVPNIDQNPYISYAKIWHSDEISLGDVSITAANEGTLPRTATEKIKDLFTSVKSLKVRSKRIFEELKNNPAPPLANLDQEMLNNLNQPTKQPGFLDDFLNRKLRGIIQTP
jgi:S1-C subfamily serine protease